MSSTRIAAEVLEAMKSTNDPALQERRVGAVLAEYAGDPDTFDLEGLSPTSRRIVHETTLHWRAHLRLRA
ncbi:hypothetical protein D869_gp158 [Caulobacter phage CcrRogue]|uniref:Uncharacterized protein n=1 Tax=Caulobacter phage CcrRogue TaxID=2927986 RepID=K4JP22_9CAUD|nr:hypothetical protein D869_gp158 [Caulobacter phage CcrRogue]AFU86756.1 hypothetical protein CcrRogue_gp274 [Caulobacter phage CcrRogue]